MTACSIRFKFAVFFFLLLVGSSFAAWQGTDDELVNEVEYRNFRFFRDNQGGEGTAHLFWGAGNCTGGGFGVPQIAGDGYGIASLCVGAYRGWIDEEEAYRRILGTLQSYDQVLEREWFGFYNHWNDFYSGAPAHMTDISGIDTAWFLCGALMAAEYFKGTELADTANRIFDEVQWRNCQDPKTGYTEFLIITIIGSGSSTYAWNSPDCRNAWNASTASTNYWAPLFVYQWPQNFVDFRHYRDDAGANHFEIMQDAIKTQRWQCAKLHRQDPEKYKDFGPNGWGLTSATVSPLPDSDANARYLELAPWAKDGRDEEYWSDSGTLSPIGLPACMAHCPELTLAAMKHMCNHYEKFDRYSFPNTLNTGKASSGKPFQWNASASMDFGANVLAVENYRSGMPWHYFMKHPVIQRGMKRCGLVKVVHQPRRESFDKRGGTNAWGGVIRARHRDSTKPRVDSVSIPHENDWVNGRALRMVADGKGDLVGFGLSGTDQSDRDMLSFWVKGRTGRENFFVALQDTSGNSAAVSVTNFWAPDALWTNWTRLRIPLKNFAVTGNPDKEVRLTSLKNLFFGFQRAGTILIDDLAFLSDDILPSPPDSVALACIDGVPSVRWGRSGHDDVVGYHLWRSRSPSSGYERVSRALLSAMHIRRDSAKLLSGEPYYYAVQCVDRHGNAGPLSSERNPVSITLSTRRDMDWPDGQQPNTFGGRDGAWGESSAIQFVQAQNSEGVKGWIRQGQSAGDGKGVYIQFNDQSIADYQTLEFKVKSSDSLDTLLVGLKSTNGDESKKEMAQYYGDLSETGWQTVSIPLLEFSEVDLTAMDNLSFTFNDASEFYLDAIQLFPSVP